MAQYIYRSKNKAIVEYNIPPKDEFFPLGYDKKSEKLLKNKEKKKHYRYFLNEPLENSFLLGDPPFTELEIVRGKRSEEKAKKVGN